MISGGRPASFGAPPEPRKRVRNRARDPLGALGGPGVDFGSIRDPFWFDFHSIMVFLHTQAAFVNMTFELGAIVYTLNFHLHGLIVS